MPKLPIISGKNLIKKLEKIGYTVTRQKGSHVRMINNGGAEYKPITIPLHRTIRPGLLSQIMKDSNLSIKQFIDL